MFKAIVIETPNLNRAKELVEALNQTRAFEVVRISATMVNADMIKGNLEFENFRNELRLIYARDLLPGEYGCAISHNIARELIAMDSTGGLIFEDDARILNVSRLVEQINHFFESKSGTNSIFSLAPFRSNKIRSPKNFENYTRNNELFKLMGHPELALSYALTSEAARALLLKNKPVHFLADWPPVNSTFYVSPNSVIKHGDDSQCSLIDPTGQARVDKSNIMERLLLLFSFFNRNKFKHVSFIDLFRQVFLLKMFWRLDNFRFRIHYGNTFK